ncbi:hypothetical protein [Oryzihumus sp.]|jgi:hypothetical protein|uniref:hypothetical protein n=1 Tax=Oryzihumus sp. TaxID=1968903 RepID=UPI002ED92E12
MGTATITQPTDRERLDMVIRKASQWATNLRASAERAKGEPHHYSALMARIEDIETLLAYADGREDSRISAYHSARAGIVGGVL